MRVGIPVLLAVFALSCGCHQNSATPEVVVYVSVDQVHAEPALREFERQSGIKVRAVYDVEASKTTGLANRIVAERNRPQADVFWNGEFVQTLRLASDGVLESSQPAAAATIPATLRDPEGRWFGVGARFRVILINKEKWRAAKNPVDLEDFAGPAARDTVIALPLFGSSAAQAAALYAQLGPATARNLYQTMRDRGVRVVDGNSVVRDLVSKGEAAAGWTDSDDACEALSNGENVEIVLPDQTTFGTLLIPGTVARVKGAPHPRQADALIDYLLRPEAEAMLIRSGFFQASVRSGGAQAPCLAGKTVKTMQLPLGAIAAQLESSRTDIQAIFNR